MKAIVNHDDYMRERLGDPLHAAKYLEAAIEDGEPRVLLLALRRVADAQGGMSKLAHDTGLTREALYRMLGKSGNPRLTSLAAILAAIGLRLTVMPAKPARTARKRTTIRKAVETARA